MKENKIDGSSLGKNSINGIPTDRLNDEHLQSVIDGKNAVDKNKLKAGKFGELLGTNIKNESIHIALIICVILLFFCLADLILSFWTQRTINMDLWNLVIPVITLSLGYIFGKSEKNKIEYLK